MRQIFSALLALIFVFAGIWIYDDLGERKLHEFFGINNVVNSDDLSTDKPSDTDTNTYNLTVNTENCIVTIKRGTETIIAGENVLNENDTIIITAIADDGYEIETLLVNNVEIASGGSYVVVGNTIITVTAVELDPGDPGSYVVQNGLKLVYDIPIFRSFLCIGLAGLNGGLNTYGYAYDWDIYLDNKFYDNYSGVTASDNYITIINLNPGEHIVCLEDKTGNDYCARSVNFTNSNAIPIGINLTEVYGYGNAFNGSSLMPNYCYWGMFGNCIDLTIAPELPAMYLNSSCYIFMFCGCINLTTAPELPAMYLSSDCYAGMFIGCINLTIAPELLATMLPRGCYCGMFKNCSSLTSVTCYYPSNLDLTFASEWLYGISTTGTLKSPNGVITYGLPDNWEAVAI